MLVARRSTVICALLQLVAGDTRKALARYDARFHRRAEARLHELVRAGGRRLVVFDVGANDGAWSRRLMHLCRGASNGSTVAVYALEPQPQFHTTLDALAAASEPDARCQLKVVHKAA